MEKLPFAVTNNCPKGGAKRNDSKEDDDDNIQDAPIYNSRSRHQCHSQSPTIKVQLFNINTNEMHSHKILITQGRQKHALVLPIMVIKKNGYYLIHLFIHSFIEPNNSIIIMIYMISLPWDR